MPETRFQWLVLRFMILVLDMAYMHFYHPGCQPTDRRHDILKLITDCKSGQVEGDNA